PLLCRDAGPAGDCAADRTPAAEALVDLCGDLRLLLERQAVRLDLRIGDVADPQPARRAAAHLRGNQAEYRIAHLGYIAETLQLVVVVRGVEAEEVGGD